MDKEKLSIKSTLRITIKAFVLLIKATNCTMILLFLLSILSGLSPFANVLLSKNLLDSLTEACKTWTFNMDILIWLSCLFVLNLMLSLLNNIITLVKNDITDKVSLYIQTRVLEKSICMPMKIFDDANTYNQLRFTTDQTPIRCVNLVNIFFALTQSSITFISIIGIIIAFNWLVAAISILLTLPLFFLNKYISEFWYKISVRRVEKSRFMDVLKDLMLKNDNIKELKLFNSLPYIKKKIISQQTEFYNEDKKTRTKFCALNSIQQAVNDIVTTGLKLWIIFISIFKHQSLGTISMFINSIDQVQSSIITIGAQIEGIYEQAIYLQSLFQLLEMSLPNNRTGKEVDKIESIEFRNVSFAYPQSDAYVLKNLSFVLRKDKTYALIGLNGSGKTTLLKLLTGLYAPTKGTILINGVDINQYCLDSIRSKISAIFQDFIKYPFTVKENIIISSINDGEQTANLARAISFSGAEKIIQDLSDGLDTQLQKSWDKGTEISHGQWQKIAIARCIYKKSFVYLFDEPFSALDAFSERNVVKNIKNQCKNSINVFITHRYSSLTLADTIIVLDKGEIIEKGTHSQLLNNGGYYAKLIKAQTEPINALN